jgi:pimeloyl-ACP methyl ester carboxylesterase
MSWMQTEDGMVSVRVDGGVALNCVVDDFLWPWDRATLPVVMMHGYARNATFWNRWVPPIAATHRVYRPELRGCGGSDVPPPGFHCDAGDVVRDIVTVLDALELPCVHWIGESSGGLIGLALALAQPERIASLALCNAPTRIPDNIRKIYSLDRESAAAAIRAHGVGHWCRETLGYRLDVKHASPELCEWYIAEMDKTRPDVAAALMECFEAVDLMPHLGQVRAPVLLLSGDQSKIASEHQAAFAKTLPDGRVKSFAGYGHGVNLLQPEACAAAVLEFWGTLPRA